MKLWITLLVCALFTISCGEKKEEKKDGGFEINRTKTEETPKEVSKGVPVDLNNKGIGPITSVEFGEEIDTEMAARGEEKFNQICVACHLVDQRMVGPAMKGIYERRSPEWVMNMILNPDGMLKEDPIAIALYEEYNFAIMLNQNLTEEETRDIAEYLRTL